MGAHTRNFDMSLRQTTSPERSERREVDVCPYAAGRLCL